MTSSEWMSVLRALHLGQRQQEATTDPVLGVDDGGGEEAAKKLASDVAEQLAQRKALAIRRDQREAERDLVESEKGTERLAQARSSSSRADDRRKRGDVQRG